MEVAFIVAGFAVGLIVGLTGIGGGSLMTPILLWFGVPPATAVGSDLLYAAITKGGGVLVHQRAGNVDWRIVRWLAGGSVPATVLTLIALHIWRPDLETLNNLIKHALGIALLLTALAILLKTKLLQWTRGVNAPPPPKHSPSRDINTLATGALLGVLVTLTSIGAGAVGTVALFLLYPLIPTARLVGTEIAHAVPLTLVAGLGHAGMGHIDWGMLGLLLCGSLPGIWIGSHMAGKVPDGILRPILAIMLAVVGTKLVW
ncbi:sulfite exporter TauE/SafE family protein [Chitinimonas sp. BJYL2]|uniref:sulfite exporter TauE/SafE family protein n=1 Tax=Chitinimonas sp. BJYL2 TaxID=2976696 RepID=UPI0022B478ED|nr:sulfite exporter TauE/SafE family protein [Chitinimonas sp. BJYL2]